MRSPARGGGPHPPPAGGAAARAGRAAPAPPPRARSAGAAGGRGRGAAMPTLLPAAVNDPQDDVSSPTFGAYRREATAAACLDGAIALLAGEAGRGAEGGGGP